jgi:uncharacterized membrane protein YhaH (DUF805 family)
MNASALDSLGRPRPARLFSLHGRLGRARYTTYTLGALVGAFVLMYAAGRGLPLAGRLGATLYSVLGIVLYYALLPVTFAMLTVRRAHDFNRGGWVALLLFAPFVNLLFWFIPGTRGANRYGAAPRQEPMAVSLGAIVLPLLLASAFFASAPVQPPPAPPPVPSTSLKPYTP